MNNDKLNCNTCDSNLLEILESNKLYKCLKCRNEFLRSEDAKDYILISFGNSEPFVQLMSKSDIEFVLNQFPLSNVNDLFIDLNEGDSAGINISGKSFLLIKGKHIVPSITNFNL